MSMAAWRRRSSRSLHLLLLIGTSAVMANAEPNEAQAGAAQAEQSSASSIIEELLAAPLTAPLSPASLRMANGMLSKAFNRGVDDIDSYALLSKLIIQHALNLADRHPTDAADYRRAALPMTYNLAANTWPGWGPGEVGALRESHRRLGLAAARLNVELAAEVNLPPARRRNGYWALGAQLLAAGDYAGATSAFATSRDFSDEAKIASGTLMAEGWIRLTEGLAAKDEALRLERFEELERVRESLRKLDDDGAFYADQYGVALEVFQASAAE